MLCFDGGCRVYRYTIFDEKFINLLILPTSTIRMGPFDCFNLLNAISVFYSPYCIFKYAERTSANPDTTIIIIFYVSLRREPRI